MEEEGRGEEGGENERETECREDREVTPFIYIPN